MDKLPLPPLLSPNLPRFAPPRGHTRTPSRSPTRANLADDILSDLSPATTLEAFTNSSGKLKSSIEAATPSERAFGLRATLASKKIQEWVDELSAWPWPVEGGSLGFEIPSAKRRKLSDDRGWRNRNSYQQEPIYVGSLRESEVESYENRIDDITADMEDLNVEEIKRQVLDTHFSPRSRPSSSASNAPPMPTLFASYTRMDDFTAVITATVLHALPNLSRLNHLMDVWNIRLSVLRKVPPLMIALEDAEIAIRSGWNAIETADNTSNAAFPSRDAYLSRETFEIMRDVLQGKVTTLGQNLDYMLDTLEGREDTLPDTWLDRMETIENDYGSWVVYGDRKVREGEWAKMAQARKEEDDVGKLKDAEGVETAIRKAEEEARWQAQLDAEKEEVARVKAGRDAQEAARLKAEAVAMARQKEEDDRIEAIRLEVLKKSEKLKAARLLAIHQAEAEAVRFKAEDEDAKQATTQKIIQEAQDMEDARLPSVQQAENARIQAEQEAIELDRQNAFMRAKDAEDAILLAEQEVELAKIQVEKAAKEPAYENALEATQLEFARLLTEEQAAADAIIQAKQPQTPQYQAPRTSRADTNDSIAIIVSEAKKAAREVASKDAGNSEPSMHTSQWKMEAKPARGLALDLASQAEHHTDETSPEASDPESAISSQQQVSLARRLSKQEHCVPDLSQVDNKTSNSDLPLDTEDARPNHQIEVAESSRQANRHTEIETKTRQDISNPEPSTMKPTLIGMTVDERSLDCDRCEEIRQSKPSSHLPYPSTMGTALSSGAHRTQSYVESLFTANFNDSVKPQINSYAPFDGQHESSEPAIRTTEVEIRRGTSVTDLASPYHLDDSFPQTPTSSTVSSAAKVLTSPTSEESSPPRSKVLPSKQGLTIVVQVPSDGQDDHVFQPIKKRSFVKEAISQSPHDPNAFFSANQESDIAWTPIHTPEHSDPEQFLDGYQSDGGSTEARASGPLRYPGSEPSPVIHEAQPAEYFSSPTKSLQSFVEANDGMPSESVPVTPKPMKSRSLADATPTRSPGPNSKRHSRESTSSILSPVAEEFMTLPIPLGGDSICDPCEVAVRDLELLQNESEQPTELPILARRISMSRMDSQIRRISTPRRASISSDTSTVVHDRISESPPSTVVSPISEGATELSIEQSPSAGRIGHRSNKPFDNSPSNSPPAGVAKRPSLFLPATPSFSSTTLSSPAAETAPPTPLDAPIFSNVDVSTIPIITSPKKVSTDEQMQQQISSLLESIPARIHLTTSSDTLSTPFTSKTLRPKKTRRSTPSYRSSSSMSNYSTSSRAPTPSFTLAPVFGKTYSSRPRPQSSNPEIKLYHLSRSTGEAPIKLFVRLVGEHGERVMVRVGGGWADLGEYLKEYASHHGRRSAAGSDKGDQVQIQDLPSRNVSSSSTATLRGSGRLTPDPYSRPYSVERDRQGSNLIVRKTRRSIGDSSTSTPAISDSLAPQRPDIHSRTPSTPLPSTSSIYHNGTLTTTPGSNTSTTTSTSDQNRDRSNRSASRLSWTPDDLSGGSAYTNSITNFSASLPLGLAGPKSRNVVISERDQEWVESMKEKVRLASAEKEKRDRDTSLSFAGKGRESAGRESAGGRESSMGFGGKGKESSGRESSLGFGGKGESGGRSSLGGRESRSSFGEMEKVGGTKRLFRKGL
ncbi:hypothetical protein WAI453_004890 [Rhynchosporium graminicola]